MKKGTSPKDFMDLKVARGYNEQCYVKFWEVRLSGHLHPVFLWEGF